MARGVVPLAAGAAAGLAMLLVMAGRHPPSVPPYSLVLHGGDESMRCGPPGGTDPVPRLSRGSLLGVTLRPWEPVRGEVTVHAYLLRGGRVRPWEVEFERSPSGVLRLQGPVEQLMDVAPGTWEVMLFVGRPGELPALPPGPVAPGEPGAHARWRQLRHRIELLGDPPSGRNDGPAAGDLCRPRP